MSALVSVLLLAAPTVGSSWKGNWTQANNLVATATAGGKRHKNAAKTNISVSFKARVDDAGEKRPREVLIDSPNLSTGPFTIRDDGGAAAVVFKKPPVFPPSNETVHAFKGVFGRLVLDDAEREAMSSCGPPAVPAAERWLMRTSAAMFNGEVSETKLANVVVKCAAKKDRTVFDVAWDAEVAVGVVVYKFAALGTVTVDPAVWVSGWSFGGPLEIDSNSRTELKVKGTFKSSFTLTK
jgi:hypothetical protein